MKFWLIAMAFGSSFPLFAANSTPLTQLKFADEALQECVFDAANSANIHRVEEISFVQCDVNGPISLKGLAQLPALQTLVISDANVKDLDALANSPKLTSLMLTRTHFEQLKPLQKPNLDVIFSDANMADWRQLGELRLGSLAIQHPQDCHQLRPLAHDKRIALITQNSSTNDIATGMLTSPNANKTVVMLDCPLNALQ